jgi:hypothetical protein
MKLACLRAPGRRQRGDRGYVLGTVTLFPGEVGETTLASAGGWDAYVVRLGWDGAP